MATAHEQLQTAVVQLCNLTGWHHLTVRRSIGKGHRWVTTTSVTGWPDLLLWSTRQPGRHLAVELKVPPDRLKPEQQEVLAQLAESGFETYVWTPEDLQAAASILAPPKRGKVPQSSGPNPSEVHHEQHS
jgi:hypothetical protein